MEAYSGPASEPLCRPKTSASTAKPGLRFIGPHTLSSNRPPVSALGTSRAAPVSLSGKNCRRDVIGEPAIARPIGGSEPYEGQLLSPVKHHCRYRARRGEILAALERGHATRLLPPERQSGCRPDPGPGLLALATLEPPPVPSPVPAFYPENHVENSTDLSRYVGPTREVQPECSLGFEVL